MIDEAAERKPSTLLERPRDLKKPEDVRQHLIARLPESEPRVRAGLVQELSDRERRRPAVSIPVERREGVEGSADRDVVSLESSRRRPKRMKRAVPRSEEEQALVPQTEERPPESREHRELVVRPLDRGERHPHRFDLLALMEPSAPDENVGDVEGGKGIHVRLGDRPPEALEPAKQETDVRGRYGTRAFAARAHAPSVRGAFLQEPSDPGGHRQRLRALDGIEHHPLPIAVGARDGKGHDRGLALRRRSMRVELHVVRLVILGRRLHRVRHRGVHELLNRGHGPKAHGEMDPPRPGAHQLVLHALVERDVGPSEPVDRLLGVGDEEKLPRDGHHLAPVVLGGIRRGEKEKDLGLEGIGVLELVDEDVSEARLELAPDLGVLFQKVAGASEEVEKIEAPSFRLQRFVPIDELPELVLEMGREVGAGAPLEGREVFRERVALGDEPLSHDPLGVGAPAFPLSELQRRRAGARERRSRASRSLAPVPSRPGRKPEDPLGRGAGSPGRSRLSPPVSASENARSASASISPSRSKGRIFHRAGKSRTSRSS